MYFHAMSNQLKNGDERFTSNVEVRYTYNGQSIDNDYLEKHPDVKSLFMSSVKVNAILAATRAATLRGMFSRIEVTEHGVKYSVTTARVAIILAVKKT
jgi:hypothetical protein